MKLTTWHKEAFVNSVMNDVPEIDYQKQLREAVDADMLIAAPKKIVEILKDPLLRQFVVNDDHYYRPNAGYGIGLSSVHCYRNYEPSMTGQTVIANIVKDATAQFELRGEIRRKVKLSIVVCTTVKVARERMPDLAKYLPEEAEKGKLLPATIDLTADLVKAGWPTKKVAVAA